MTASPPATFAAHIPTITVLRDALQYGDLRLPRSDAFNSTLTIFRKTYVTSTGVRGIDVHNWKSAEHQAALTEMSQAFLDRDGNGELYWPADPTSPNVNSLQYLGQRSLIRQCIKQLIYRLNLQQFRNAKYRRKSQPCEDSQDGTQETMYASIEISSDEETLRPLVDNAAPRVSTSEFPAIEHSDRTDPKKTSQAAEISNGSRLTTSVCHDEDNIFTVPDSPDLGPLETTRAPKRPLRKLGSSRLPKRPKPMPSRKTTRRVGTRTKGASSNVTSALTPPEELNISPRPELAPTDQHNNTIASPIHASALASAPAPARSTPEELINYIRNNRPLRASESTTGIETTHVVNTWRENLPIDPTLGQRGSRPDMQLSQGGDVLDLTSSYESRSAMPPKTSITTSQIMQHAEGAPVSNPTTSSGVETVPKSCSVPLGASKPNVQFIYRVILAHRPVYDYQTWVPKGNLLHKTLLELENELPVRKGYESFILRLRGPDVCVEEVIKREREEIFEDVKRHFDKVVRSLVLNQVRTKPGKAITIFIEIEPQRSEEDADDIYGADLTGMVW